MLTPQNTYIALLIVQALHLLHHRLVKRHISFAEVVSAVAVRAAVVASAEPVVDGRPLGSDGGSNHWKRLDTEVIARMGESSELFG